MNSSELEVTGPLAYLNKICRAQRALFFLSVMTMAILRNTLIAPHHVRTVTIERENLLGVPEEPLLTQAPFRKKLPTIIPKKTQRPLIIWVIIHPGSLALRPG